MSGHIERTTILFEMERLAEQEAEHRGLNASAANYLSEQARDIVESMFEAIRRREGEASMSEPTTYWRHRNLAELNEDWRQLEFDREELRSAAERYVDRPWMQLRALDWLILNSLTYAELLATIEVIRARTMPLSRYVALKSGSTTGSVASALWRTIMVVLKWGVWFLLFSISLSAEPYAPLALIGVTAWWLWKRYSAKRKIDDLLASMQGTYAALSSISNSWAVIAEELKKSRDKGAVWDGIVYRLVEERTLKEQHT
jgi:hypothetical protein